MGVKIMKKVSILFLGLILLFVGCSNKEEVKTEDLSLKEIEKTLKENENSIKELLQKNKELEQKVENLNKELQNKINPYNQDVLGFRVNDKVIQLRNDYSRERTFDNGKIVVGVFNGDMGRIIKIDKENEYIYVRFEDGSVVKYEFDERENLALAYALTIHKSQGSEYPVVVIPIYDFIPMLTTRNLIYTGVTRAKKAILLIGSYKKMQLIIRNMNQNKRYSNLKDELNKLQKGEK